MSSTSDVPRGLLESLAKLDLIARMPSPYSTINDPPKTVY